MSGLLAVWNLVNNRYGAVVAGLVVLGIVGFAWYFGYSPSQVLGWLGK